jgi:hypothetical protein
MDFLTWFLVWLVEWMSHSTLMIQIYFDSGYMAVQQQIMPFITQEVHDRLEAWIMKDEDKK